MNIVKPPLIELRQYIIAPGKRDRMIELFNLHFAKAQDELGMPILGYFRATGDPDRLVWLRGFPGMETRSALLGAFYGGPVWTEFGREAIGYVTGYDNVQLLREVTSGSGLDVDLNRRLGHDGILTATTYRLREPCGAAFLRAIGQVLKTLPESTVIGTYMTDPTPNDFPVLPIREGEHLYTWFATAAVDLDEREIAPFFAAPAEKLLLETAAA